MPSPTGSTPVFGLPYPLETDIPDVATALQDLALAVESLVEAVSVPIGGDLNWWSTTLPALGNWAFLHGQTITGGVATYPALAALITAGNAVGSISGGNIVLADTRNRLPMGAGSTYSAGATGGATSATLGTANIPQITAGVSITDPGHEHLAYVAEVGTGDQFVFTSNVGGPSFSIPTNANAGAAPLLVNNNPTVHIQTANTGITASVTVGSASPTSFSILNPYIAAHRIVRLA